MESAREHKIFRFSSFEVDLDAGELRKDGVRLKIQDQPFQILGQLLHRPGEIVSREEVKQKLWPEDTFVDFEQGLNSAVKKLRDVLGDSPENPSFVETIPRKGYRFIHNVELYSATWPAQPAEDDRQAAERTSRIKSYASLGFGMLFLLLASSLFIIKGSRSNLSLISAPPIYHQLTFARQFVKSARFAPDQRTIVYNTSSGGVNGELLLIPPGGRGPSPLGMKDADVAAISPAGEMLLITQRKVFYDFAQIGVLSRAPMTGGAPRPVLRDVQDADWGPKDEIAVAHLADQLFRVEYPIGRVLYETSGYVSHVRVSPKGDMVAFADHPKLGDNSGTIAVVDNSGHKRTLTPPQTEILGVAWKPDGKEIWFSGTTETLPDELAAVDLQGHLRVVANVPGGTPVIQDFASDGRVLLTHENSTAVAVALGPGQDRDRALSIRNWSLANGISPDGRQMLIEEQGVGSQPGSDIYLQPTDGSPPVRLGEGEVDGFSPDMKSVLASRQQLFLIPLGPGEPQQITHDSIVHTAAAFMPDGKSLVFTGTEAGHGSRIYIQALGDDHPRPISPEGVIGSVATPDGRFVFGNSDKVRLYPIDGQGTPRVVPGIGLEDMVAGFTRDGSAAYVASSATHVSLEVTRLDLATGKSTLIKKITPADSVGVFMYSAIYLTPDLKYYTYSYSRTLSQLYLVEGLH